MVAYTFYEGDNRVRRYAETLVKRGDVVDAIVLRREGQSSFEVIAGVNVYRIQERVRDERGPSSYLTKLLMFFLRSTWVLTQRHLSARYDIIHVHSVPDFQVFSTLVPRLMGAKVILDIHDIVPELYASKFKISERSLPFRLLVLMERLSVRYSDHVIISNHLWHERLVRRSAQPERCTTILNYPDLSIFYRRPRTMANGGEFIMCYPGTLSWHQGVDIVIGAMAQLRDKVDNLRFLILGDGAERDRLIALAKEHGIEDRVTIIKGVPIEEVAQTMANVDLGLEPKRKHSCANEALSTKILEFMAMGVPVLASDTRVHKMYFTGDMVEFFDSENIADLAAKILELMRDPARRTALRERGMEFILENNWDLKKNEYLDLVDHLVKRGALIVPDGKRSTPQPN
jgi:glycosyltransferase involved in cell wall biosynthesis